MSDDQPEEIGPFFASIREAQEHALQQQKIHMDMHTMEIEEIRATVRNLMDALSGPQLYTLIRIINYTIGGVQSGSHTGTYWAGQAAMLMELKHGMDSYTGEKIVKISDLMPGDEDGEADEAPAVI
jgi:hypothetical protein